VGTTITQPKEEKKVSNPRDWRAKPRTTKPNSRQKRNGLFLDMQATCRCGAAAQEAYHDLPHSHPDRYEWQDMRALCRPCQIHIRQHETITIVVSPAIWPTQGPAVVGPLRPL
jgi:hypothetical protein